MKPLSHLLQSYRMSLVMHLQEHWCLLKVFSSYISVYLCFGKFYTQYQRCALTVFTYFVSNYVVEPGLLGAPVNRDYDMKRGILTMKHGLDLRNQSSGEPPLLSRLPTQAPSLMQPQGGWLVEDDISRGPLNSRPLGFVQEADSSKPDKQRAHLNPFSPITPGSTPTGLLSQTSHKIEEVCSEYYLEFIRSYFLVLTILYTGYWEHLKVLLLLSMQACAGNDLQKQILPPASQLLGRGTCRITSLFIFTTKR